MSNLLTKKWDKYGYKPVGFLATLKFVANKGLSKLYKMYKGYSGYSWLQKPFKIDDIYYNIQNDFFFKVSNQIDFMVGRHETFQDIYFVKNLKKGSIFIDVGAHIGRFSLLGAQLVGKEGMVLALEPDQRVFKRLIENVKLNNFKNINPLPIAASNQNSLARFKLSTIHGWSSFTNIHEDAFAEEVYVSVYTMDTIVESLRLDRIDLIKIDVEGAEGEVLEGSSNLLKEFGPALLIEVHGNKSWQNCKEILERMGYQYSIINKDHETEFLHLYIYAYPNIMNKKDHYD